MQDLSRRGFVVALVAFTAGVALTAGSAGAQHVPCCGAITDAGLRLAAALDAMDVERLWLAGEHINWETGEPDRGSGYTGPATHTHCSAFAAAAAKRLGVYLLRPPEHGQELLSNAQAEWLAGAEARRGGWRGVRDGMEAQKLANKGMLVVVVFESGDAHRPGHVAIVRPSEKSLRTLEENGPEILMAGEHNHQRTNARMGFEHHAGAWPTGLRYYAHGL